VQLFASLEESPPKTLYTIDCPPTKEDVLEEVVTKHCLTLDRFLKSKPIAAHTREAFERMQTMVPPGASIVMDSGCGTGRSTRIIGSRSPSDHWVLGIDRSLVRLERNKGYRDQQLTPSQKIGEDYDDMVWKDAEPGASDDRNNHVDDTDNHHQDTNRSSNVLWIRAELIDFWRLMLENKQSHPWKLTNHYLLYPNPYPKLKRLKSRFYAHPGFPILLRLGGDIIIRSNWKTYLEEFAKSVLIADQVWSNAGKDGKDVHHNYARPYVEAARMGPKRRMVENVNTDGWSNFERKMDKCGEPTFELILSRSSEV
jgi:tRNA G46 methylase TrmB